jgi:hypothetical protein
MSHVWWHCDLVGDQVGTTTVKGFKVAKAGSVYCQWAPPHTMPAKEQEAWDALIQMKLVDLAEAIAAATKSKRTGDPIRHEEVGLPPLDP